jgi:transcriptional regulator
MHPNSAFRSDDHARIVTLVEEIGFGMVFAATPDGPRVAHTPLLLTGDGALQFHLSRGNALVRHLDRSTALALVNGPDGYISPDWYETADQVPTWNYLSVEMEGRVRRMDDDGLIGLLDDLSARQEQRLAPKTPWTRHKMQSDIFRKMLRGIVGFELEILAWRPTFKLSQNKSDVDRAAAATALAQRGQGALAQLMRSWGGSKAEQ